MSDLRAWRQRNKMTQEQLEAATGIPQSLISKYEKGVRPGLQNALRLAEATNGEIPVESWAKDPPGEEAAADPQQEEGTDAREAG